MKKIIFTVWIFSAVFAIVSAAEFSVRIIPTKAVNIDDQFRHIMPNRPPFFPKVSRVVCGEPFKIEIVFTGARIKSGAVKLTGKLVLTDPAGKKDEIPLRTDIGNISGDSAGVFLFPQSLMVVYEPHDPKGKCIFDVELTDANSGKTATASASVEYVEKTAAQSEENAFEKIGKYYLAPCPENIVPAFKEFLENLPKQKAKEKNNFNPLPQLAFFYFLLKENPQCVPEFTELFKSLHNEEKYLTAVVLNFVSDNSAKALSKETKDAVGRQFPADPFQFEKALVPWQLDVCWAEFFVRGTKEPVMKIVNAMGLAKDSLSVDDYKKLAKPTSGDRKKLLNGLTASTAQWSMKSLVKTHPMIRYYVETALLRDEVKDPFAAALSAKIIDMEVKVKK